MVEGMTGNSLDKGDRELILLFSILWTLIIALA